METDAERIRDLKLVFGADPCTAHMMLFQHRHELQSPDAHYEVQSFFHGYLPRIIFMAFRDFAKSTIIEEGIVIEAISGRVRNVLILAENEERGKDRLRAVKHELEYNELIRAIYGEQVGETWGETKIILANGCCIQIAGRGQSLRGIKHLQWRPDLVILDDVEDEQSVSTSQARRAVLRWWTATVRPALAKHGRVRMLATPMSDGPEDGDKCLPLRLAQTPEWKVAKYPVKFVNEKGEWEATWPAKFDMSEIEKIEEELKNAGRASDFAREYMCEATAEEDQTFPASIIPSMSAVRSPGWRPTFAAIDPARTVRSTSDFTGWAVWSWEANKLVVWESGAERLTPDQIIDLAFDLHKRWGCCALGIEEDGLNDFLFAPLSHAARERGTLPSLPLKAPKGKRDFISQLVPFFRAGEIEFNGPSHQRLRDQLLAFPTGKDDAPNALAYAISMRGVPRYPLFGPRSVVVDPRLDGWEYWITVAAKDKWLAAALIAVKAPRVTIVADVIEEGDPRAILPAAACYLGLRCEDYTLVAGPAYHDRHDLTGLRFAAGRIPKRLHRSGEPARGLETITKLLRRDSNESMQFQVAETAKWSLRAFGGGGFAGEPLFKPMALLLEAIESLMANYRVEGSTIDEDKDRRYAVSPEGRRYLSASPHAGYEHGR